MVAPRQMKLNFVHDTVFLLFPSQGIVYGKDINIPRKLININQIRLISLLRQPYNPLFCGRF